jgi:DNA-binding transcriptional MerR regulator
MTYTIKQAAEKVNLTIHTLRFYDKEGLLPFVKRDRTGNRIFTDSDLEWLGLICCLKNTGMPIKQIRTYIQWCLEGDRSVNLRRQMLIDHRQAVIEQIDELKRNLEAIDYKIAHYTTLGKFSVDQKPVDSKVFATD